MKLAIAKPEQAGPAWDPYPTNPFASPAEIREGLRPRAEAGVGVVTLNRTVLDTVRDYDEVWVWDGAGLVPLLDLHDEDWLAQFSLGDLLERGLLTD